MTSSTDAELIRRSQHEPEAFGRVFDRHVAAVHAFAQRRVGRDLAEEVTAETFARGFEARVDGEVLRAVARLPRRQREVLLLAAWADLSYAEIAQALDLPVGTVRSRLARARSRLGADEAWSRPDTDVRRPPQNAVRTTRGADPSAPAAVTEVSHA
jgi:DNA-directed RNA polymerase specialized sigma24 family protein